MWRWSETVAGAVTGDVVMQIQLLVGGDGYVSGEVLNTWYLGYETTV